MRATDDDLKPLSGGKRRLRALAGRTALPEMRRVGAGDRPPAVRHWIGLRRNGAYRVTALEQQPLLPPWLALLLIVGALLLAWRMEGR